MAASTGRASRRRPYRYVQVKTDRQGPDRRRLHHHPAGGQELPSHQRALARPQAARRRCSSSASSRPSPRTRSSNSISTRSSSASTPMASPPPRSTISASRWTSSSLEEMAYLAALAQGPQQLSSRSARRNAPSSAATGCCSRCSRTATSPKTEMKEAQAKPLEVNPRPFGAQLFAAESFAEEVRRELIEMYGKDKLEKGGLSVRTTLDPKLQIYARQALARGLIELRPQARLPRPDRKRLSSRGDWGPLLKDRKVPADVAPWRLAVVLEVNETEATHRPAAEAAARRQAGRRSARRPSSRSTLLAWARAYVDGTQARPRDQDSRPTCCRRRRDLCRARRRTTASIIWCRCRTSKAHWSPWTRTPAACCRWSAASPMAGASSIAPSRRCASRARPSSPSSMPLPSTMATRRPRWCSMRRSSSRCRTARSGSPRTTRTSSSAPRPCAAASSSRAT